MSRQGKMLTEIADEILFLTEEEGNAILKGYYPLYTLVVLKDGSSHIVDGEGNILCVVGPKRFS